MGDALGQLLCGFCLQQKKRNEEALEMYEKAAEQKDGTAIMLLTNAYMYGKMGLKRDYGKMRYWLELGLESNIPLMYNIQGFCYEYGRGFTKNMVEAMHCYEKALQGGVCESAFNLGRFYENGYVVEIDTNKAIEMYLKAIELGSGEHKAASRRLKKLGYKNINATSLV